ncbi:AmmeMemoRadiSam system radical SAM enzyme [candidate division WOR-3 bacterium]|nr:AmmeMemoRadiSam system radical SAM enzyme [candidate division WOR-3 bacterium]
MDLFFERVISRRDFLKTCGILTLSSAVIPHLLQTAHAQEGSIGFTQPVEALYYEQLPEQKVRCSLCPRFCTVPKSGRGFCRVRENRDGTYYTLAYANPCAIHIDPIEKKPLYHFLPGTTVLSLATAGCNFTCKNCQNWDISQAQPDETYNYHLTPAAIAQLAQHNATPTIAYTYTEPTVFFEYMLATAKKARALGIRNVYHSNGYINPEPLRELAPYLDGANVDLKAMSDDFYASITGGTLSPVLETLKNLKEHGVWLEITNLIIPTRNDSADMIKDLCQWINRELGPDTPVHFSRFYPQYKIQNLPPTPVSTLKNAAAIARAAGLLYTYIGNVPDVDEENTFCPHCGKKIIERKGYTISRVAIKENNCSFCSTRISGVWQ